jgi:hypothetical protein
VEPRSSVLGKRGVRRTVIVLAFAVAVLAASAQPAPAAVIGLTQVAPQSAFTSANKGITATCPAGMNVLSAGADTTPGQGEVVIDQITPSADLRSVRVRAHEDDTATPSDWYIQAFATCAYPPPGLVRVTATTASNSASKGINATCPAGKKLFGIGADLSVSNGNVLIDRLSPNSALTALTAHAVEDEDGTTASWALHAYAICATPVAGMERVMVTEAQNAPVSSNTQVACPGGKGLLGAGGQINGAAGQIVLDAVYSDPGLTKAGFAAWEDETGTGTSWSLTTYGICAPRAALLKTTDAAEADSSGAFTGPHCPEGQEGYGVGYRFLGASGQVWPTWVIPFYNDDVLFGSIDHGSFVLAYPDANGASDPWSLEAQSVCATPLAGTELVAEVSDFDNTPARQAVSATCPLGKNVVAGGGRAVELIDPPNRRGESMIEAFAPESTLTSVDVRAIPAPLPQYTGQVDTEAAVQCATPPPGLELVTNVSFTSSVDKVRQAACPPAKHVIGSGAQTVNGFGRVVLDQVDIKPDLSAVTASASEIEGGTSREWSLRVYAICIT